MKGALEKFATVDARKAELVKLRYFVGLSVEELRVHAQEIARRHRYGLKYFQLVRVGRIKKRWELRAEFQRSSY